ncbi:hypothetical protein [Azospirillum palustre]
MRSCLVRDFARYTVSDIDISQTVTMSVTFDAAIRPSLPPAVMPVSRPSHANSSVLMVGKR